LVAKPPGLGVFFVGRCFITDSIFFLIMVCSYFLHLHVSILACFICPEIYPFLSSISNLMAYLYLKQSYKILYVSVVSVVMFFFKNILKETNFYSWIFVILISIKFVSTVISIINFLTFKIQTKSTSFLPEGKETDIQRNKIKDEKLYVTMSKCHYETHSMQLKYTYKVFSF
jgi:hypothetical protein